MVENVTRLCKIKQWQGGERHIVLEVISFPFEASSLIDYCCVMSRHLNHDYNVSLKSSAMKCDGD